MLFLAGASLLAQSNPVPHIDLPLVPTSIAPGGPEFTVTVNGAGFASGAVVFWNGHPLATQFIGKTKLTATVPASDIATAGTASVTVQNSGFPNPASNVALLSVTNPVSTVAFTGSNFPSSGSPEYVAVGDFNNDGKMDLAVADYSLKDSIAILLGNGDGTFKPPILSPASPLATWIAVGDFNGDAQLDLAVAGSGEISLLRGNGDGTFQSPLRLAVKNPPLSLVAGDFNGDGKLDLAGTSITAPTSIFLGNGDGTFHTGSTIGPGGYAICTADFNGDGIPDLALTDFGTHVKVSLGNGDGTFQREVEFPTGDAAYTLEAVDLNGDGIIDLVAGSYNGASVLLGKGDGSFGAYTNYFTSYSLENAATVADLNGDGIPDIAVGDEYADTISILLGNGDGTFQLSSNVFESGINVQALTAADFNNDGAMDLALAAANIVSAGGVYVSLQTNGPAVLFSPVDIKFSTQLLGTPYTATVLLINVGKQALDIAQIGITGAQAHDFTQADSCGTSVAAGARCSIDVTFTPQGKGDRVAALVVQDDAINRQQSIPLSGVGTWMNLSPPFLNFDPQKVGTVSAPMNLTLENIGTGAVAISSIRLQTMFNSQFRQTNNCGNSIAAGASCTISVQFAPTMTGSFADAVGVKDNGGGVSQQATLSGTGTK